MFFPLVVGAVALVSHSHLALASPINWNSVDWSAIDWKTVLAGVNWSKVKYPTYSGAGSAPAAAPAPASGGGDYQPIGITGPVVPGNFPDPSIIHVGSTWYAFGTETIGDSIRVQVATSPDFKHWTRKAGYDGLARLPPWANTTTYRNVWAPDVSILDNGSFIMYFSALVNGRPNVRCIGAATASSVLGPYQPGNTPLVCPSTGSGVIDPMGFKDWTTAWDKPGGQRYLVYKSDDEPTPILLQKVAANGFTLQSSPTELIQNRGAADGYNTEGPVLVKGGPGDYFLFFSTGDFRTTSYTVSYATARSPFGPWTRQGTTITSQLSGLKGPGGMDVDASGTRMAFAAVIDNKQPVPDRGLYVTGIRARNGNVNVG